MSWCSVPSSETGKAIVRGLPRSFPLDLASLTVAISAVAVLYGGVRAFYFEGGFLESFSYFSDERTFNEIANSLIGRDPNVTLFGIHAFGDYVLPNVWASFDDPWVELPQVNYLPPVLLVSRVLGLLPYTAGFIVYFVALAVCTIAPMIIASRGYSLAMRALLVVTLAVMTGPAIATFDRGNWQGFLPLVLFVFAVAVMKQRWGWAATMIAIASLIKIYPIVLILLLVALRQYRWALVSVAISAAGFLVTLPLVAAGGLGSLGAVIGDVLQFQERTIEDFLQYNVSLAGGVANTAYFLGFPTIGAWVASNPLVLIIVYGVIVIPILWIRGIETWMKVILALSLTTALMPIVYAYALNWVLASTAFTVWIAHRSASESVQARVVSRGLALSLALGTAVLPVLIPGAMEAGRPAGAVTFAALVVYLLVPALAIASRSVRAQPSEVSLAQLDSDGNAGR